jgi:hypothetical protein
VIEVPRDESSFTRDELLVTGNARRVSCGETMMPRDEARLDERGSALGGHRARVGCDQAAVECDATAFARDKYPPHEDKSEAPEAHVDFSSIL